MMEDQMSEGYSLTALRLFLIIIFYFFRNVLLCDFFEFEYFIVFCLRPSDGCPDLVTRPLLEDGIRLTSEFFILLVSNPSENGKS